MLFAADRHERAFTRDEVALLSSLAAHAAVALDNARLLAETRSALIGLEQANAALREQSQDIELAVLAHDRLAELVLRGGGVAEVAAELSEVLGGRGRAAGARRGRPTRCRSQSAVPVATGSELLGRLVLTRAAARPRPADLRVLERGAVVTALLLLFNRHLAEVANRGPARPARGPAHRFGHRTDRDRRQGRRSRCRPALGDLVAAGLLGTARPGRTPSRRRRSTPAAIGACPPGSTASWCCWYPVTIPARRPARRRPTSVGRSAGRSPSPVSGSPVAFRTRPPERRPPPSRDCLRAMLGAGPRTASGGTTAELGFVGVLLSSGDTGREFVSRTLGPLLDYDAARGSDLAADAGRLVRAGRPSGPHRRRSCTSTRTRWASG